MAKQLKILKTINGQEQEIPVVSAFTIFDQNSQTYKKLWIGSEAQYLQLVDVDTDTIYLIQQSTV